VGLVVVLGMVLALPGGAAAQAAKEQAKQRYLAAQTHYNLNEFPEALKGFKDAYRLYPDPVFLFNIGQCERQLGNIDEAVRFYRSYLRNQPDAPNRNEVEKKIEELKALQEAKQSATQSVPLAVIPPAASDDRPNGLASAPEVSSANRNGNNGNGNSLPPAAPVATPVILTTAVPEVEAKPVYKTWWFWTASGVAVAAIGVGLAVGLSRGEGPPGSGLGHVKAF
jgi:hypothetical protein